MSLPRLDCGCCVSCCDDGGPWCRQHGCTTCAPSLLPDLPVVLSCPGCRAVVRRATHQEIAAVRAGLPLAPPACPDCHPAPAAA